MSSKSHPLDSPIAGDWSRRSLPPHIRLLCVGSQEPPWPLLALRLDAAGCGEAEFEWQSAPTDTLATLRKSSFDLILIKEERRDSSAESSTLGLVEAVRASGTDDPIAVILTQPNDDLLLRLEEFDCEVLISTHGWQSRALVATIRRAVVRGDIRRDVTALESAARRGRVREREEAELLLRQLQSLVTGQRFPSGDVTEDASANAKRVKPDIPPQIETYYCELLRTYVMMGSGILSGELQRLAEVLSLSGVSMRETVSLHLRQVESLVNGLGNRSSRHIMSRANLLALELMIHLGECYRSKSRFRGLGDNGVDLLHAQMLLNSEMDSKAT